MSEFFFIVPLHRYNGFILMVHSNGKRRRLPKNVTPCPRRPKQPPEFGVNLFLKKRSRISEPVHQEDLGFNEGLNMANEEEEEEDTHVVWEADEIEAISSLFEGRIPQKPGKLNRERPLPLPLPHKVRPLGLPTPRTKVRELGHMGCPGRALQTFCWAQKQPELFPDDRILASTIEVLGRNELKVPFDLKKFTQMASRAVLEAMVRGFIKGGSLKLAWKLLLFARKGKRMLDPGIYAKLVLELGKNPDKHKKVMPLLDELGEREELNLNQQDCTAIMKVCTKMGKFDLVENLFRWFKNSGHDPSIVMYTTVIHSRYSLQREKIQGGIGIGLGSGGFKLSL
ncbi:hypothetical protein K1719_011132 [Acacia pycnantha]|nr:hypothetical protein K1719_011132 [Acacia pycnantha]